MYDDLESAGYAGLVAAARGFDPSRGVVFSSLAIAWIRYSPQKSHQKAAIKYAALPVTLSLDAPVSAGKAGMPSAVYPSRFTQIAGISLTDSTVIYNAIKAAGKLDANDFQISDPNDVDYTGVVPALYASFYKDIGDELNAAYTAHQFSAATARRVLDFFVAQL